MKQRLISYFNKLKKLFRMYNIKINSYSYILCKIHGKKRKRNLRRI